MAGGGLVLGVATSFAQGLLPDGLRPLANSASGWTSADRPDRVGDTSPPAVDGALFGVLSFVALVVGYALASNAGGSFFSPVLWSLVGVVAGPVVGVAASWLHARGWRRALGAGVLAGVGLGRASTAW